MTLDERAALRRILRIAQDGAARFPSQAVQFRAIIAEAEALLAHDVVESTHRAAVEKRGEAPVGYAAGEALYRCSAKSCPGLPWRASDRRHPCVDYDREATQALVATEPPDPKAAK